MGRLNNALSNALFATGWLIIITSVIADIVSAQGMVELFATYQGEGYTEYKEIILSFITGIFQAIGLGLLCLYAGYKLKQEASFCEAKPGTHYD